MKFKKFVKSLGADGILYVRENGERWLSSGSIFMKVPEDIRTVTACDSAEMLSLSLRTSSITIPSLSLVCWSKRSCLFPMVSLRTAFVSSPQRTVSTRPLSPTMATLSLSVVTWWKCTLTRRFPLWLSRDLLTS